MAGSTDDELARTATAGGTSSAPPAPALAGTLGRYRIERTLGEGGMGVVHAAFDPDLERRVALKVLRAEAEAADARQRLLREARAMARLTHPNVVTVHEVGSASGRDYVAMELVEGETLADWLRAERRKPDAIIDTFVAAGRGLAAAHAAGLVHRDFKPHNVLRGKDGRICVTDFGLARGVDDIAAAFEATVRLKAGGAAHSENTPSPLSGLTATGSVLGTPAYMAPEQWIGGTVGPAADQFAFCVALWEALTGERPFRGPTLEELKREVAAGGRSLDASKLPRRLRAVLRRGLEPDPAKRWPSMDALITTIVRGRRRRDFAQAIGLGVLVGCLMLGASIVFHGSDAPGCAAPAVDPDTVWSAARGAALAAAGRASVRDAFARDFAAWQGTRARACAQPTEHRAPVLACLDGVLERFAAVGKAVEQVSGELPADAVIDQLVDPHACEAVLPPRLTAQATADVVAAFAFAFQVERQDKPKPEVIAAFLGKPGLEPCAHGIASLALAELVGSENVPKTRDALADAATHADACGDDRLRADAALAQAPYDFEVPTPGPKARAAVERAKVAVDRVAQPDLDAEIDLLRAQIAIQDKRFDEAFAAADRAMVAYTARGLARAITHAVGVKIQAYFGRNAEDDMQQALALFAKERPLIVAEHDEQAVRDLDKGEGLARLFDGDLEAAHAELTRSWKPQPHADVPTQAVDGTVVDANGTPVSGATVVVGMQVWIDSFGVLPFQFTSTLRMTTTDARGAFAFADAPMEGVVAALAPHAVATAAIAPHVKLVMTPTRRIAGRVELHGASHSAVFVVGSDRTEAALFLSPLARDGTFAIDGVPTTAVRIGAASWARDGGSTNIVMVPVPAGTAAVEHLALEVAQGTRTFDVVVRSAVATPLNAAEVFLFPGKQLPHTVAELKRLSLDGMHHAYAHSIVGEAVPHAAADKVKSGDLIAHFTQVQVGDLSVCAIGLQGDLVDPVVDRSINAHGDELELRCATAAGSDDAIIVVAPPQKRFD